MQPQDLIADEDPRAGSRRLKRHTAIAGAGALTLLFVPGSAGAEPAPQPASAPSDSALATGDSVGSLPDPALIMQSAGDALAQAVPAAGDLAGPPPTPQPGATPVLDPAASTALDPGSWVAPVIASFEAATAAPELEAAAQPAPSPTAPALPAAQADEPSNLLDPARIFGPVIDAMEGETTLPTRDHIARSGESWGDLARNALPHGASPEDIQAKADRIREANGGAAMPADGQVVKVVPSSEEDPRVLDRPQEGTVVASAYVGAPPVLREVQPGETLTAIASSNLAPDAPPDELRAELARLKSLNPLRDGGDLINPGDVILVQPPGPDRPLRTGVVHPTPPGPPEPPARPLLMPDGGPTVSDRPGPTKDDRQLVGPDGKTYPVVMPDPIPVPDTYHDPDDPEAFYDTNSLITPDAPSSAVQTSAGYDPGWVTEGQPVMGLTTINDPGWIDYLAGAIAPIDLSASGDPAAKAPYRDLLKQLAHQSVEPSPESLSGGLPPDNDFLTESEKDRLRALRPPPGEPNRVPQPNFDREEKAGAAVGGLRALDEALEREIHIKDSANAVYHVTYERNTNDGRTRAIARIYQIRTPPSGGEPVTHAFYGQPKADGTWAVRPVKPLPPPVSGQEFRAR